MRGHTAEDIQQEIEVSKLKSLKNYDAKRGNVNTFLHTCAKYDLIKWLRNYEEFVKEPNVMGSYEMGRGWELSGLLNRVEFNKQETQVMELYFQDLTFKEIGEKLGYTQQWATKWFQSAVDKLRKGI
jgi:DNA-directed RNA polymerase specialized sigma24 family protein